MSTTDRVLSDFIDAWNAGRRPDAGEYLRRVPEGPERDELAEQLATWLEVAPTPAYDDAARAAIRAEPAMRGVLAAAGEAGGLWPAMLPELRARAGLSVGDVAARVLPPFGLAAAEEPRAEAYLRRLERGELEPTRVSRRLLDALGALLGVGGDVLADAGDLASGLRPAAAGSTLFRRSGDAEDRVQRDIEALSRAAMAPAPAAMDELDRLFTGGRDA